MLKYMKWRNFENMKTKTKIMQRSDNKCLTHGDGSKNIKEGGTEKQFLELTNV